MNDEDELKKDGVERTKPVHPGKPGGPQTADEVPPTGGPPTEPDPIIP